MTETFKIFQHIPQMQPFHKGYREYLKVMLCTCRSYWDADHIQGLIAEAASRQTHTLDLWGCRVWAEWKWLELFGTKSTAEKFWNSLHCQVDFVLRCCDGPSVPSSANYLEHYPHFQASSQFHPELFPTVSPPWDQTTEAAAGFVLEASTLIEQNLSPEQTTPKQDANVSDLTACSLHSSGNFPEDVLPQTDKSNAPLATHLVWKILTTHFNFAHKNSK